MKSPISLKMAKRLDKPLDESGRNWIRNKLQGAETQLDSLTQKLARTNVLDRHSQHSLFQQGKIALMLVRKIQFRYFNVDTLSMLRYYDSKFDKDGKIIRHIQKSNWRKYKKEQDRKKNKKIDE